MKKEINPNNKKNAVLKYREHLKEDQKREFVITKEKLFSEENRLARLEYLREKSIIELHEKEEWDITLKEIGLYYTFVSQMTREIDKQKETLKEVKKHFDEIKIRRTY